MNDRLPSFADPKNLVEQPVPVAETIPDDMSLIEIAYAVVRGKLKLSQQQLVVLKELLPTVLPKLTAVATTFVDGKDFASMLDRAIERSQPKLIELQPEPVNSPEPHSAEELKAPMPKLRR
jgi:hypothetical protein